MFFEDSSLTKLNENSLIVERSVASDGTTQSTIAQPIGTLRYFEIHYTGTEVYIGFCANAGAAPIDGDAIAAGVNDWMLNLVTGELHNNGVVVRTVLAFDAGDALVAGDIVRIAYENDGASAKVWIGKNDEWVDGVDPALLLTPLIEIVDANFRFVTTMKNSGSRVFLNSSADSFSSPVPSSFSAAYAYNSPEIVRFRDPADEEWSDESIELSAYKLTIVNDTRVLSYDKMSFSTSDEYVRKVYCEVTFLDAGGGGQGVFFGGSYQGLSTPDQTPGMNNYSWSVDLGTGAVRVATNDVITTPYTLPEVINQIGDRLCIAMDVQSKKVWFGKNGVWFDGGDPVAGTGENLAYTYLDSCELHLMTDGTGAELSTFGFNQVTYTVPAGFAAMGFTPNYRLTPRANINAVTGVTQSLVAATSLVPDIVGNIVATTALTVPTVIRSELLGAKINAVMQPTQFHASRGFESKVICRKTQAFLTASIPIKSDISATTKKATAGLISGGWLKAKTQRTVPYIKVFPLEILSDILCFTRKTRAIVRANVEIVGWIHAETKLTKAYVGQIDSTGSPDIYADISALTKLTRAVIIAKVGALARINAQTYHVRGGITVNTGLNVHASIHAATEKVHGDLIRHSDFDDTVLRFNRRC